MGAWRQRAFKLGVLFLLLVSAVNVARIVSNNLRYVYGAGDFYVYWYYGHFLRQGENPYQAFVTSQAPETPVTYLDGPTFQRLPQPWAGLGIPTITAPIMLLLSLFAWISWPIAKAIWMVGNLAFMAVIPWCALRLLPDRTALARGHKLAIFLIFFALSGTRNAGGNGQTALFVFLLLLITLLRYRHDWLTSGLAFGLALSKYSLALPVFLFLLYKRSYRVVISGLVVQTAGVLFISALSGTAPLVTVAAYVNTLFRHVPVSGIHVTNLLPNMFGTAVVVAGSSVTLGLLGWWVYQAERRRSFTEASFSFADLQVLNVLFLWTLLVAYHGNYDTVVVILFFTALFYGLEADAWRLSRQGKPLLQAFSVLAVFVMILPRTFGWSYPPAVNEAWSLVGDGLVTGTLAAMLALSLWLLYRSPVRVAQFDPAGVER